MKIFYENENYSKYGRTGSNYVMSLIVTSLWLLMTAAMLLFIALAVSPDFYRYLLNIHFGVSSKIVAAAAVGLTLLFLRITVKEESLANNGLTREYVKKAVNILLIYIFLVWVIIGFIVLKFLRHYNPQ
jgi:hypothetical protein